MTTKIDNFVVDAFGVGSGEVLDVLFESLPLCQSFISVLIGVVLSLNEAKIVFSLRKCQHCLWLLRHSAKAVHSRTSSFLRRLHPA